MANWRMVKWGLESTNFLKFFKEFFDQVLQKTCKYTGTIQQMLRRVPPQFPFLVPIFVYRNYSTFHRGTQK
ncbi:MAG: hypothetical protein ACXACX_14615 [Candidatus Hodarchaeales archaeon]